MNPSSDLASFSIIVPTYNRRRSLEMVLDSLLGMEYPRDLYEIIVVDDGSKDDTSKFLDEKRVAGNIRVITIPNSGPAVARNRGAAEARGAILAFVDDDCTAPAGWLRVLNEIFFRQVSDAVGGAVRNGVEGNIFADVYDEMQTFSAAALNERGHGATFITTNNFACRADVFRDCGGFDERFHVGAEDREFVARLLADGKKVQYESSMFINHFHAFNWKTFIHQYFRFGKGSYLLFGIVAREKGLQPKRLPLSGYIRLLASVGRGRSLFIRAEIVFLTILAQACAFLGYLGTAWEGIRNIVSERTRAQSAGKIGIQGRAPEMVSYLIGTLGSSALGFASFLIMGRVLSVEQFGGFTLLFSLSTLLQTISSTGMSAAVTRHAVEGTKGGDLAARAQSMKSAAVLFVLTSVGTLGIAWLAWDWLVPSSARIHFGRDIVDIFLVGTLAAMAFDFFGSVYAITYRLLRLSLLRFAVSLIRMCAIVGVLMFHVRDSIALYAAFFLPNWLGVVLTVRAYMSGVLGTGRVSIKEGRKLAGYAGWQTFSSTTAVILQHAGSVILAAVAGQDQVGYYGLGLTFSFIYSVVAASLASYFIPIGMRLRSNEDVLEFVRRTTRLSLPIAVLCIISLLVIAPLFSVLFGDQKAAALPVFVLLSLSAILGIGMVGLHALFHYFFKPRLVTYAQIVGLITFVFCAAVFSSMGAVGIAAAILGARVALFGGLLVLIRSEFSARRISAALHTTLR